MVLSLNHVVWESKRTWRPFSPVFPLHRWGQRSPQKTERDSLQKKMETENKIAHYKPLIQDSFCCTTLSSNTLEHMFTFDSFPWPRKSAGITIPVLLGGSRMKWLTQSHTNWVDTRNEMPAFKSDALCSKVRHLSGWRKIEVGARCCTTHCQSLTLYAQILSFHTRFPGLCLTETVLRSEATKPCYPDNSHHLS